MDFLDFAVKAFADEIAPTPEILPSQWGRKNIVVTKGPKAGKLWTPEDGAEYQEGMLDQLFGPFKPGELLREGAVFKGAQAGISLITLKIGLLFWVVYMRLSAFAVVPRKPDSTEIAAELKDMIQHGKTPREIKRAFRDRNGRIKKTIFGSELGVRSAETDRDLIGWGAAVIVGDEIDRWSATTFDPHAMLPDRQGAYDQRIRIKLSTPTFPEYGIHKEYETSNQQAYFIPCPLCGERQTLSFGLLKGKPPQNILFDEKAPTDEKKIASARFVCVKCGKSWNRRARKATNKAGEWVAAKPAIEKLGFELSRLYVPAASPGEFVKGWIEGQRDELKMREFVNQKLGLPYLSSVGSLEEGSLDRVISSEVRWGIPPSSHERIFGGIDVQGAERPFEYFYELKAYDDENHAVLFVYGVAIGAGSLIDVLSATYGGREISRALIDATDGHHLTAVRELVAAVDCLEAARTVWQQKTPFERFTPAKGAKAGGLNGFNVMREPMLDSNMTRFFEAEIGGDPQYGGARKKPTTILVARNPKAAAERLWKAHYKRLRRVREETPYGPRYVYAKKQAMGVDYPFAGALAEVARQISGDALPSSTPPVGRLKDIAAGRPSKASPASSPRQIEDGASGILIVKRRRRGRY